jgi:chromosome partitioning protein
MGKVLVITNRKGGCGKSFTTASLGVGLARQGKKVLLLDTDNQHSLTVSMGVTKPEELPVTLATVITDIINKREIDPAAGLIRHLEGIDLMPANSSLTGMEISLAPLMGLEILIKKYLGKVKHLYDYCLIDTSPTLDILTINALAAADNAPSHCEQNRRRCRGSKDYPPVSSPRRQGVRVSVQDKILWRGLCDLHR